MKIRTRKAIGTFLTVAWITVYSLVMMAVGAILVLGRGMALELPFYIIAGLGWVPLEMWIIKWMSAPIPNQRSTPAAHSKAVTEHLTSAS
jgi:hypothetical protein